MESQYLDLVSYQKGLELQAEAFAKVKADPGQIFIFGLEHPAVVTRGRRLHSSPANPSDIPNGFELVDADRGGELALHSPGQLVIYPILSLRNLNLSVNDYICLLVKSTQEFLKQQGVETVTRQESGLWTPDGGKIMFVGIRVKEGISYHGIAINVYNDLSVYQNFNACGVKSSPVSRLKTQKTLNELFKSWTQTFLESQKKSLCSTAAKTPSANF